jgi:MFS family permease
LSAAAIGERIGRRIYYGWIITGSLAVTETVSWGILFYAFATFLVPMNQELGWSNATLTGAYSLALLISGLAALPVGRWLDRHGPRAIMTAGSILGVLLVLAWSQASNLIFFYLIWAGIGVAMSATLYEPAFATVTTWFERDRPKALLSVTLVAGFASTIFLPLSGWLIGRLGWREALITLAIILALVTIPLHLLVLRRRPEDLGLRPDGARRLDPDQEPTTRRILPGVELGDALRDRAFWWMATGFSLETFTSVALGVHLIPYLTERGDGAQFAATIVGLIGAAQVVARVLATIAGNRISQVMLTAIVFALQAIAILILMQWQSRAGVLFAVLLFGAGRGVVTLMRPALIAEFFGRTHFGAIQGALSFVLTGARALGPVTVGVAYGLAGGYRPVLWGMAAISVLAAASMAGVNRQRADPATTMR